ncbi:MAG: XdhC family protein, partial [Gemmatimonadota bacterium]
MRELLPDLQRLLAGSTAVGRGVVISVWGSAPQPVGSVMIATADGRMEGAVCGGCIEGAVLEEIHAAISRGTPRLLTFGVSEETAWSAGLACGGKIEVLVEPAVRPELIPLLAQRIGMVLVTVLGGLGGAVLVTDDGREPRILPAFQGDEIAQTDTTEELTLFLPAIVRMAEHALGTEISSKTEVTMPTGALTALFEVIPRPPRLIIFGAGQIAAELVPMARRLGFETIVADGREAFLSRERFAEADRLVAAWPEDAFAEVGIDQRTYICLLSHDPKFDEPALRIALRSPARYIGA